MDNFIIPAETLDKLNDFADQIMDIVDGSYPFFIIYATENRSKKTSYKYFYSIASELGYKLCSNKMKDIFDLHNIPRDGTPCSFKDFSMPDDEREQLKNIVNSLMFYCQNAKIPCFVQVAIENNIEMNNTEYIMDIISPYRLLMELYDDKITKALRYTLDTNIYPSRIMDLETDLLDIHEIVNDVTKLENDEEEIYPDQIDTESSEIFSAPVYDPGKIEPDAVSDIIMESSEIIEITNKKSSKNRLSIKNDANPESSAEQTKKRGRKKTETVPSAEELSVTKLETKEVPEEIPVPKKRGRKKKSETVLTSAVSIDTIIENKEVPDELPVPKKRGRKKKSEISPVSDVTSSAIIENKEVPDDLPKPKKRGRKKKSETVPVTDVSDDTSKEIKEVLDELPKPKRRGRRKKSETVLIPDVKSDATQEKEEVLGELSTLKKRGRKRKTEMTNVIENPRTTSVSKDNKKVAVYSGLGEIIDPIMETAEKKETSRSQLYNKYKEILEKFPDDFLDGNYD
jgi:hypothetical protein